MSYFKKHKEGFILTIVFHAAVLLLLLSFGFFTPLPLPDEKGVLVDFGNSDNGFGKVEPAPRRTLPVQQQPEQEQLTPPPPPTQQLTPPVPVNNEGPEEMMTQEHEKTVAIDQGKKKAEEEAERKRLEEEARIKKELEDQLAAEKLEQQKQEELERQQKALAEQRRRDSLQRIEEARLAELRRIAEKRRQDSIRLAEEQAKIDAINSRTKNAFGGSTGQNDNTSSSGSQGVTYGSGNQGTSTGTAGAERYGLGGGEGISYNLSGRSAENLRKPEYPGEEEGTVVVKITVDKYGKVTKAEAGQRGSTTLNPALLNAAKNAALSTRFNEDVNAPAFQVGSITYKFVLN